MIRHVRASVCVLAALTLSAAGVRGAEPQPYSGAGCAAVDDFFADDVWAKVGAMSCLKCHSSGGDAEDSKFVLRDLERTEAPARAEAMRQNRDAFTAMARRKEGVESRLLLKASGKLKHEGEEVLKPDSTTITARPFTASR